MVGVQLHSKEAIAGFHFQFHRWNVKVSVNQLGERREVNLVGITINLLSTYRVAKNLATAGCGASACRCLVLHRQFLYVLAHACSWTATTIEHKAGDAGDPIGAPLACRTTLSPTMK